MTSADERPRRPRVILALIAVNLLVFAIEIAYGADAMKPTAGALLPLGANYAPLTLGGEPWRLVTAMFLHFGAIHVGMNMLCLWQGRIVEQLFGPVRFTAIYLVSGLVGGAATLLRSEAVVSAGASGAVFGVYGAFAAFLWLRRARIPQDVWQRTARSMGTFLAINLFIGLSVPGIDMRAHAGGLVAGFACGAALLAGARAAEHGTRRAIGLLVAGVAIGAAAVVALPVPKHQETAVDDLGRVEEECISRTHQILAAIDAGTLSTTQAADQIDRDVIAPWKAVSTRFRAAQPPARLERLYVAYEEYIDARLASWEALTAALRAPEADAARLREVYEQKSAAVGRALEHIKHESQ